jgi:hypothetical protein
MIVAFTVSCLRERNLRQSLDSWARVRGVQDVGFVFCLEPPRGFPVEAFRSWAGGVFRQPVVWVNPRRLGCLANTRQAMDMAMALSKDGFGVVAEEDLEVSDDIVEYLNWARQEYQPADQVTAVCAHARASTVADDAAVTRASWFNPLVWGTWKDRWQQVIKPGWGPCEGNTQGWDRNLQLQVETSGRQCVFPVRSRVIHRGETSTITPLPLGEYFYRQSVSECFASHYSEQDYHEVPYPAGVLTV